MSIRIYVGTVSKRKNSTYQPTLSTYFDCDLKMSTSVDEPTFLISAASFPYNYIIWDSNYYFVTNRVSVRNNQWEVSAKLDVLATAKTEILASTQYVCYSSMSGGTWLADTRIPVTKETQVSVSSGLISVLNASGVYLLTANGQDGCRSYLCTKSDLTALLSEINTWALTTINNIVGGAYQWNTVEEALESLGNILCQTDILGNAYQDAPNQIKSCIWVPFDDLQFADGSSGGLYLGAYATHISPLFARTAPVITTTSLTIPWHYSDWRRAVCEDVYLYLPMVGYVSLSGDSLTHTSSLSVKTSATITDGVITYEVSAGGDIIGVYGGQCAANYPIGISQQASAGEVLQTMIAGAEKMVAAGIGASLSPSSIAMSAIGVGFETANTAYQVYNTSNTRHNTVIGGIGGGAGAGLDLNAKCYTVAHPTVISPSAMQATMGIPTMQPVTLSSLSGYCQCANAHVEAALDGPELDAIDAYLNSGFYIE